MLETAPEALAAVSAIVSFMNDFGVLGIIALILAGPFLMAIAVFVLDFLRQRHARQTEEMYRLEAKADRDLFRDISEQQRVQTAALVEEHRRETAAILRDFGEKHTKVAQYYKDNVDLLKHTQRLATDMRDIILHNTKAFERLTSVIESNFFCPLAREAATGKK